MKPDIFKRNNIRIVGQGTQPMLLAHGFGCDQNVWRFLVPAFERDYRLVLFDYVGSGQSDLSAYDRERYDALRGYADDVLEICEALDLQDVIFVGHSVSSMIGMLAAIREPARFSRLIMIGPSPRYLDDAPGYVGGFKREEVEGLLEMMEKNYMGWASFLAPVVMRNPESPELAQELEQSFCANDPNIARHFAKVTFLGDNRADLHKLRTPSLILQCADDALAPMAVGHYLSGQLRESTLVEMKATGHCPHVSHPAEVIAAMREYLQQSSPGVPD